MKAVFLVMHQNKPNGKELLRQVVGSLRRVGIAVLAEPWLWEGMGEEASSLFLSRQGLMKDGLLEEGAVDAVLSVGGDGTFLRANQAALRVHAPVLGINVGHIGFLTELELEEFDAACQRLREDAFSLEPRMMLKATLPDGSTLTALNDVVLSRGGSARLIAVKASVDQELVGRYIADGLIVSTPTGSTGYSLSAGGPIVCPDVDCIVLSPICAHSLQHRPVVSSSKQTVVLELDFEPQRQAQLSIDGQEPILLQGGQKVAIVRAPRDAQFIRLEPRGFFQLIRFKLSEWSC